MTSTLQSRMEELIALKWGPVPERGSLAKLARAADVKSSSVAGWLNGKTKELSGPVLLRVAEFFGVNEQWLATGKGPREPLIINQLGRSITSDQVRTPSHSVTLDPEILHEALMLLVHDESQAGDYPPRLRSNRLAELYQRVAADGGRLTAGHNEDFIREVEARRKGVDGGRERIRERDRTR
jgi:transcriptional regulator with XRE-family HTH domain